MEKGKLEEMEKEERKAREENKGALPGVYLGAHFT